jgi:phosphoribosyl 1,2-cyclic phosphodiesterase
MIGFCPLASGSKGNAIYLGTPKAKILIDAGISAKMIVSRLEEIQVDVRELSAIIISHEHGDHIQGLKVLTSKYNIPVIANLQTAKAIVNHLEMQPQLKIFTTGEPFSFLDLEITPFRVRHDAVDPVAFAIQTNGIKIGICTDLGSVTQEVARSLMGCDILYVEANHEPNLVHASTRPDVYKNRVLGPMGHLSNEACGFLLKTVFHPNIRQVYLAHLSSECNTPEVATKSVSSFLAQHAITLPLCIAEQETKTAPVLF